MTDTSKQKQGLDGPDAKKRETLKRLALGAAFVVPVVTSLSLEGMTISKVHAAAPAGSDVRERKKKEEPKQCKPQPTGNECNPECGDDACSEPDDICSGPELPQCRTSL